MSERQGIEIDYCPSCRGVWLDRGELDKIIERSAADLAPAPSPAARQTAVPSSPAPWHRGSDSDHRHHGSRKRKKSFLEELFD
jgi:hypothetical protein